MFEVIFTPIPGRPSRAAFRWIALLAAVCCSTALAQRPEERTGVRITFLPPPMEGTLSLGIYDKGGKLVRALHREAAETEFTIGLNGLITTWDGKDDAGRWMPAGKYFARGFAVGDVHVEGVAMRGNDWMTEENSPRIARMVRFSEEAEVSPATASIAVELASGQRGVVRLTAEGNIGAIDPPTAPERDAASLPANPDEVRHVVTVGGEQFGLRNGKLSRTTEGGTWTPLALAGVEHAVAFTPVASPALSGFWVIDREADVYTVKLFTAAGEFKRRMMIPREEPTPFSVSSNADASEVRLLEAKPGEQRLRILRIVRPATVEPGTAEAESLWEVALQRVILESNSFPQVADKLGRAKPFLPEEKIRVRLLPNELFKGAAADLDVRIAVDAHGAHFQAADGLPLAQVTETKYLKWAVVGREKGRLITILQSDGAVIEEFKASRIANMMAFDAGEYEWAPPPAP